jgi:hypothetical protein
MVKHDCDICRGSGFVNLPIWAMAVTADNGDDIRESSRRFACPQCDDVVREERIGVLKEYGERDLSISDPAFAMAVYRGIARQFADALLQRGFIRFEEVDGPERYGRPHKAVRATLGVVSKADVAKLEERIAKRQFEVAAEVQAAAVAEVRNWGSYYRSEFIQKSDVYRLIADAHKSVKARRAAWREVSNG